MKSPFFGVRYCGNTKKKVVHDLDKEKASCRIEEIISNTHYKAFAPDTLEQAHNERFDNCAHCIGDRGGKTNRQ